MDLKYFAWTHPRGNGRERCEEISKGSDGSGQCIRRLHLAGDITVAQRPVGRFPNGDRTQSPRSPERLRAKAAISLGPVLEQADTFQSEDPDDVPITGTHVSAHPERAP